MTLSKMELEFCDIYSIIFIADNERQTKISKMIICPKKLEVKCLIFKTFSRVLTIEHVSKIGVGIRSRQENNKVEIKKGDKIRIETYWNDAELSSIEYLNNNNEIKEFDYFLISLSELDKKTLLRKIEQNFSDIESIVNVSDDSDVLSLKSGNNENE